MSNEAEKLVDRARDKARGELEDLKFEIGKRSPRLAGVFKLAQQHPLITLFFATALVIGGLYFGAGVITGIRQAFEDRSVEKLKKEGGKHLEAAAGAGSVRQAEDQSRRITIRPRIEAATRDLESARARRRAAESNYEKSKHTPVPNLDARDLHDRNCADLRELYPNEPIAHCDR